jgi:hypothetical protein
MRYGVSKLASILFWINLIPIALLIVLAEAVFVDGETKWDLILVLMALIFFLGVISQIIYFLQFNISKYATKRILWQYSMFANIIYFVSSLAIAINGGILLGVCAMIYYLALVCITWLGLKKASSTDYISV